MSTSNNKKLKISADVFINEGLNHVGSGGHAWVQKMTNIGNRGWCCATMCAIAKASKAADVLMPGDIYSCTEFADAVVEKYGGKKIQATSSTVPKKGDFFILNNGSHIGVVAEINTLVKSFKSVEGNWSNTLQQVVRNFSDKELSYYVRPSWGTASSAGASFVPRTTAPTENDKYWQTSYNPCLPIERGTVIPNCVGYAWGRFAEIYESVYGKKPEGLPTGNAKDWYSAAAGHFERGKTPKLGAVIVWSSNEFGHVAVVEEIDSDNKIRLSESGYGNSWANRWWANRWYDPPNYVFGANYTFLGFIYNPATENLSSSEGVSESTEVTGYAPLYTTRSTRADASIREVCYLTKKGEPSIKPTDIKLSILNYTSVLADLVSSSGGVPGQSPSLQANIDDIEPSKARTIIDLLRSKGFSTPAAIGMLSNIKQRSDISTKMKKVAVGESTLKKYGLLAWVTTRAETMRTFVGDDWATDMSGQIDFIWKELNSKDYSSVLSSLLSIDEDSAESGAKKSASLICRSYVKPADVSGSVKVCQKLASQYWKKVIPAGETSEDPKQSAVFVTSSGNRVDKALSCVNIPTKVSQTGIIADYTSYSYFYGKWASGTVQKKLSETWGDNNKPSFDNVATISGCYLVATTNKFGNVGDMILVKLNDGTGFRAIIADEKRSPGSSVVDPNSGYWGHLYGGETSVIEWESVATTQKALTDSLTKANLYGKKVAKIYNYGSYYD